MQSIVILHVNDIMAYSRILDVVSNIFEDEETFNSESGDDVYGYLGARAIPHGELIEELNVLTGGADEVGNNEDTLSNNEDTLSDSCSNYYEMEDSGIDSIDGGDKTRHKDDASSSNVLGQEIL